jgi:hypothetical protein
MRREIQPTLKHEVRYGPSAGLAMLLILAAAVIAVSTGLPALERMLENFVTDKADLERAIGERAIFESAARAVNANTALVRLLIGVIVFQSLLTTGGVIAVVIVTARRPASRPRPHVRARGEWLPVEWRER